MPARYATLTLSVRVLAGVCLGLAAAFFSYYTLRLAYVTRLFLSADRPHQTGMYIGAAVFPLAALLFGYLSWRCLRPPGAAR